MTADTRTLVLAAGLGALTGMRSMSAPALLSRRLAEARPNGRSGTVAPLIASHTASRVLGALAAGEVVADKTTAVPDRTDPGPLVGRMVLGALSGVVVAERRGRSVLPAALVGAAAAAGSTFLVYHLRKRASKFLPDRVLGFVEDAAVLAAGTRLAERAVR